MTELDYSFGEDTHRYPQFLPDGRHFSYWVRSSQSAHQGIFVGALDSKEKKRILPDLQTIEFTQQGFGIFAINNKLFAQSFDAKHLEFTGDAIPIADNLTADDSRGLRGLFSVSHNDALVYAHQNLWQTQPIWFDRSGKQLAATGQPGVNDFDDLSLDQKWLLTNFNGRLWMIDLLKGDFFRFALTNDAFTIFSPDGNTVAYAEQAENENNLFRRLISGSGKAELLLHSKNIIDDYSWSDDGRYILFCTRDPKRKFHVGVLPLFGDRKPFPLIQQDSSEFNAQFSPDGKWFAYVTEDAESTLQVYVRSFPVERGGKWEISTEGASQPKWRRDGKELYYLTLDKKLMAMDVETGEKFKTGISRMLFQTRAWPGFAIPGDQQYFVAADGQRFLVNTLLENKTPAEITVLLNWKSLLKK